jgi:glycosyltransferase involved in cell wall biosynthesis
MRVAVFTDNDFDKVNGVTTALRAVLQCAPADILPRIYTASTLAVDQPDYLALAAAGVPIPFYTEMRIYWPSWRELARRIKADGAAVLHLTTPGPLGLAALWIARRTGLPIVGSFHTDLEAYTATLSGSARLARGMGWYLQWMYSRCDTILAPSETTRRMLVGSGINGNRVEVWPRGVDTELFTPERRSEALREQWRVSDQRPALLYVGRLSREKALMALPALSDALRHAGVDHRLIFAGGGPLRRELANACPDAQFLGFLGREAVASAFASADLLVFPSETDTAGNVVLEAQAAGLPVVVSARGGPRENLLPNASGFVCEGPEAWLMASATLLRDANRRREMGHAARSYALSRRWDVALAPLFDTYRRAVGGPRAIADW